MGCVAVIGVGGAGGWGRARPGQPGTNLGQRVVAALAAAGTERIVGIGRAGTAAIPPGFEQRFVDPLDAELDLSGIEVVIDASWETVPADATPADGRRNIDRVQRVLLAAARDRVSHVIHIGSATVYGAWRDNPVPLTEDAPLRPNGGLIDAIAHAEAERVIADFGLANPEVKLAVLRPVPITAAEGADWLARALQPGAGLTLEHSDPPRQYVHVDDVAWAATWVVREGLSGTFNVAPDGWLAGAEVRALSGAAGAVPLPPPLSAAGSALAWRVGPRRRPLVVAPLVQLPWVVANDRLRATGWQPRSSNAEALLAATAPRRWRDASPRHRQELALAASATGIGMLCGLAVAVAIRRGRRRPARG